MTGTAETEETEFFEIYKLEVAVIPTNQPVIRDDRHDLVYKTRREKYKAILEETQRLHDLGYPVLIGTVNVDVSETLSRMFKRAGMSPNVLNAKYHQREAEIVAAAGQPGTVTIATNMAGRGTDIKLGAGVTESKPSMVKDEENRDVEVLECGGLHILGSERHESRRIDRQLRGRAGRQGDPGASQFFLSLEDDLMRLFGSERIAKLMDRMGAQEGEVLTHPLITRSIETAQKRVELQNFQQRKRLLEYDDVMNQQREVVYSLRTFALEGGEELKAEAAKMVEKAVVRRIDTSLADANSGDFDYRLLGQELLQRYLLMVPAFEEGGDPPASAADAVEVGLTAARAAFGAKLESLNASVVRPDGEAVDVAGTVLAHVMLVVLDEKWKDHLYDLDQLRNSINYRAWGQKDPLVEYKGEAYTMFVDLMHDIYNTFTERFLRAQLVYGGPSGPPQRPPVPGSGPGAAGGGSSTNGTGSPVGPRKRYNALGVLEDVGPEEPVPQAQAGAAADQTRPAAKTGDEPGGTAARPAGGKGSSVGQPMLAGAGGRPKPLGATSAPPGTDWTTVGRNDPCPCGSGKKYKKCHGAGSA
jgi:preprotein translocase subunit SecA